LLVSCSPGAPPAVDGPTDGSDDQRVGLFEPDDERVISGAAPRTSHGTAWLSNAIWGLLEAAIVCLFSAIMFFYSLLYCYDSDTTKNHRCPAKTDFVDWFGWGGVVAPTAAILLLGIVGASKTLLLAIGIATFAFWIGVLLYVGHFV